MGATPGDRMDAVMGIDNQCGLVPGHILQYVRDLGLLYFYIHNYLFSILVSSSAAHEPLGSFELERLTTQINEVA